MKSHRCKDVGQEWNDAATSQGMPQVASAHQNLGEWHGTESSSGSSEGTKPAGTLASELRNSGRVELCYITEFVVICSAEALARFSETPGVLILSVGSPATCPGRRCRSRWPSGEMFHRGR